MAWGVQDPSVKGLKAFTRTFASGKDGFGDEHLIGNQVLVGCLHRADADSKLRPGRRRDSIPFSTRLWSLSRNRGETRKCRGSGSNRHGAYAPRDFKSLASANSATPARRQAKFIRIAGFIQPAYFALTPRRGFSRVVRSAPAQNGFGGIFGSAFKRRRVTYTPLHFGLR